jgi:hypothetical protein
MVKEADPVSEYPAVETPWTSFPQPHGKEMHKRNIKDAKKRSLIDVPKKV